jgi:hypothetical protein
MICSLVVRNGKPAGGRVKPIEFGKSRFRFLSGKGNALYRKTNMYGSPEQAAIGLLTDTSAPGKNEMSYI